MNFPSQLNTVKHSEFAADKSGPENNFSAGKSN